MTVKREEVSAPVLEPDASVLVTSRAYYHPGAAISHSVNGAAGDGDDNTVANPP